jgi:purine-nucleoside phosphorylase
MSCCGDNTRSRDGETIDPAIAYLRPRLPATPVVGIVLGSGLGSVADRCAAHLAIPYADIPGFPICSVEGHRGRLLVGKWSGVSVAVLQGRAHRYEGHSLEAVTRPIRALAGLGVRTLITTCAAGAIGRAAAGGLLLIEDHLNLIGDNPLLHMREVFAEASRFVEMAEAYDLRLRKIAEEAAAETDTPLQRGVLACVAGPNYETAAEATMLDRLGAQAVSMSVVPEVIVARALKLSVLAFAVLTNRAGAPLESSLGHQAVVATAERLGRALDMVLSGVLRRLGAASGEGTARDAPSP